MRLSSVGGRCESALDLDADDLARHEGELGGEAEVLDEDSMEEGRVPDDGHVAHVAAVGQLVHEEHCTLGHALGGLTAVESLVLCKEQARVGRFRREPGLDLGVRKGKG